MKRIVLKFGVILLLVFEMLLSPASALADSMHIVNGMQNNGAFSFEISYIDNESTAINHLSMDPMAWRISIEGQEALAITEVRSNENASIHYIVVAESSASISQSRRKDIADATQLLIAKMGSSDRMTVLRVSSDVEVLADFTADKNQLIDAAQQLSAANDKREQALFAALETTLNLGKEKSAAIEKTAIIVFTDGYNNGKNVSSTTTEVTELLNHTNCRVFTVLLQTSSSSDASFMQGASEKTNGFLLMQKDVAATVAAEKIYSTVRKTILITGENQDGHYSGLEEDSWRILYSPNGAVQFRAGYAMPIKAWATPLPQSTPTPFVTVNIPTATPFLEAAKPTTEETSPVMDEVVITPDLAQDENRNATSDGNGVSFFLVLGIVALLASVICIFILFNKINANKQTTKDEEKREQENSKHKADARKQTPPSNGSAQPSKPPIATNPPVSAKEQTKTEIPVQPSPAPDIEQKQKEIALEPTFYEPHKLTDETHEPLSLDDTTDEKQMALSSKRKATSSLDVTVDERSHVAAATETIQNANLTTQHNDIQPTALDETFVNRKNSPTPLEKAEPISTYYQTTLILKIREPEGEKTVQVPLVTGKEIVFGRNGDVQLSTADLSIGKKHFSMVLTPSDLRLIDTSTNGTYVNGVALFNEEKSLKTGSIIQVGGYYRQECKATEIEIVKICMPGEQKWQGN